MSQPTPTQKRYDLQAPIEPHGNFAKIDDVCDPKAHVARTRFLDALKQKVIHKTVLSPLGSQQHV